jgi:hypothetical protein
MHTTSAQHWHTSESSLLMHSTVAPQGNNQDEMKMSSPLEFKIAAYEQDRSLAVVSL